MTTYIDRLKKKKEKDTLNEMDMMIIKMSMDLKNTVKTFEENLICDPFDQKKSWKICKDNASCYDFYT